MDYYGAGDSREYDAIAMLIVQVFFCKLCFPDSVVWESLSPIPFVIQIPGKLSRFACLGACCIIRSDGCQTASKPLVNRSHKPSQNAMSKTAYFTLFLVVITHVMGRPTMATCGMLIGIVALWVVFRRRACVVLHGWPFSCQTRGVGLSRGVYRAYKAVRQLSWQNTRRFCHNPVRSGLRWARYSASPLFLCRAVLAFCMIVTSLTDRWQIASNPPYRIALSKIAHFALFP